MTRFLSVSPWRMFSYFLRAPSCRIQLMSLRTFAFVPRRPSMLPERRGRRRIGAARDLESFGFLVFLPQGGQHALRRKRSFAQSDAHSVINGVGDGGNSRGQGTFA